MSNGRAFKRKIIRQAKVAISANDGIPQLCKEVWENCLKEMAEMTANGTTEPFTCWGELSHPNGQSFRVSIECTPPSTNQNPDLN